MSNVSLWASSFGDDYTVRNERDYTPRKSFWKHILNKTMPARILEIGCNTGMNLGIIADISWTTECWGVDVNQKSINTAHVRHKEANIVRASGLELPFRDQYFDLVFTAGVLIHQRPEEVDVLMQEVIRVSSQYVLAVEYSAEVFEEVPYHGKTEALFRGPFGDIYSGRYGLKMLEYGKLDKREGFDDCDYWLLSTY